MERAEALEKLSQIRHRDLVELAQELEVEILGASGKKNKGWAGHVFEAFLGLPRNSSRAPNFGSWELKSVSLKLNRKGELQVKETMAITMLDPREVAQKTFTESHLYTKLRKQILVARLWVDTAETSSIYLGAYPFDLDNHDLMPQVEADYNEIRQAILDGKPLSGSMGKYIQPRTKGAGGDAPKTRAFYARPILIAKIISLPEINVAFQEFLTQKMEG